jgi:hypothetical protein
MHQHSLSVYNINTWAGYCILTTLTVYTKFEGRGKRQDRGLVFTTCSSFVVLGHWSSIKRTTSFTCAIALTYGACVWKPSITLNLLVLVRVQMKCTILYMIDITYNIYMRIYDAHDYATSLKCTESPKIMILLTNKCSKFNLVGRQTTMLCESLSRISWSYTRCTAATPSLADKKDVILLLSTGACSLGLGVRR